jgi:hypothetical protein
VTGDGKLDVVISSELPPVCLDEDPCTAVDGEVAVLPGKGDGTFGKARLTPSNVGIGNIGISDFNGDGIEDLVIPNSLADSVSLFLGCGDGSFAPFTDLPVDSPYALAVGDFNEDGRPDLAVVNNGESSVSVFLNRGCSPDPSGS